MDNPVCEHNLIITIKANDRHCQAEPGMCCQFLVTQWPRTYRESGPACLLFPVLVPGQPSLGCINSAPMTELATENGWPVRCDECLGTEAPRG
jgi:hypothetical protein